MNLGGLEAGEAWKAIILTFSRLEQTEHLIALGSHQEWNLHFCVSSSIPAAVTRPFNSAGCRDVMGGKEGGDGRGGGEGGGRY